MARSVIGKGILGAVTAAIFMFAAPAFAADVPQTLTHQGRLYDAATKMGVTGTLSVTFNIYDAVDGQTAIWTETLDVTFDEGYFSVNLGAKTPLDATVFDGSTRYLGIQVDKDVEMSPRVDINSVPYALVAGNAIGDLTPSSISIGGAMIIDETGKWVGDPTGLVGPQGDIGPAGPEGAAGPMGPTGAMGPQGMQGDPGQMGPAGPTGAMGPQGLAGPQGVAGPTGAMGPQGVAGPTGAMGPQGVAGATGAMGPQGVAGATGAQGPQGPSGIVTTATFAGLVPSIAGGTVVVFTGPTATVTTTANQRLTAVAEAPLGFGAGAAASTALIDLCYRPSAGGNVLNFAGNNYSEHRIVAERRTYTAAGSIIPGAGTWVVGLCVANGTGAGANPSPISDNDFVNGWVQVTN